jgi:hypothetical protein
VIVNRGRQAKREALDISPKGYPEGVTWAEIRLPLLKGDGGLHLAIIDEMGSFLPI